MAAKLKDEEQNEPTRERRDAEDVFGAELAEMVDDLLDDDDDEPTEEGDGGEGGEGTAGEAADDEESGEGEAAGEAAAGDEAAEDEQELLDPEDVNDVDDEEEAPAGDAKTGEQARDEKGKFVKKDEAAGPGAPAAGETAAAETKPATGEAKWEPMQVRADKEIVPIQGASVSRRDGHVYVAIPETEYDRFSQRIGRGVVAEKMWRQLDAGIKELEARRNAPPPPSAAEIEAKLLLDALKPHLPDLLDAKDIELLELRAKDLLRDATDKYKTDETARVAKASEKPWEEEQRDGLVEQVTTLLKEYPELRGLTNDQLKALYVEEFVPVKNALFWRDEKGDKYANTQFIYDRIKRAVERTKGASGSTAAGAPAAASSASDTSAPARTPDKSGNSAPTASGKAPPKPTTAAARAEQLNRGVDAAAPRTTSVKANRTARPPKRTTRDTATAGRDRRPSTRERREAAEDRFRKTERSWLSSDSLDLEVDDDEQD